MRCWACSREGEASNFKAWRSCDFVPKGRTTVPAINAKSGFFRSMFDTLVEARQREADRYVSGVLLSLDDETLRSYGYSRSELSKRPHSNRFFI